MLITDATHGDDIKMHARFPAQNWVVIQNTETKMHLGHRAKYKYLKFFGYLFILFGLVGGYGAIQNFFDPDFFVFINDVKCSDPEAKLINLAFPVVAIVIGVLLNLISQNEVTSINNARDKFWSIFKK